MTKLWIPLMALICSCSTLGYQVEQLDYPIMTIRQALESAIGLTVYPVSKDLRHLKTNNFVRVGEKLIPSSGQDEVGFADIRIRGTKRPYNVEVLVHVLKMNSQDGYKKKYQTIGYDDHQASLILELLKENLVKRRKQSTVIDDFRVF